MFGWSMKLLIKATSAWTLIYMKSTTIKIDFKCFFFVATLQILLGLFYNKYIIRNWRLWLYRPCAVSKAENRVVVKRCSQYTQEMRERYPPKSRSFIFIPLFAANALTTSVLIRSHAMTFFIFDTFFFYFSHNGLDNFLDPVFRRRRRVSHLKRMCIGCWIFYVKQ